MNNLTQILWFILVASLVGCGGSGGGGGEPAPPPPPARFVYKGKVVNESGEPIEGAQVQLSFLNTVSGKDGTFQFNDLVGGLYNLSVQAPDGTFLADLVYIEASEVNAVITLSRNRQSFEVVAIEPRLNFIGASVDQIIVLTFNKPVDKNSLEQGLIFSPPAPSFEIILEGERASLIPTEEFKEGIKYRLEISRSVMDLSGGQIRSPAVSYFTTRSVDDVPPRLLASNPTPGATGVFRNAEFSFTFSDQLNPNSQVRVTVEPRVQLLTRISGKTVIINPQERLAPLTEYYLLLEGVVDDAGNESESVSLSFTTGTEVMRFDDIEPDWTRFGNKIVFARKSQGNYDLYELTLSDKAIARLTETPADERHPRYSSDASFITYQSNQSGNWDIFVMQVTTKETLRLTSSPEDDIQPDFSGTFSNRIAFVRRLGLNLRYKIFLMNRDGSGIVEADSRFFRNEFEPEFHPLLDGQMLFVTDEGADRNIYIKSGFIDGEQIINTSLTRALASNESFARFSPEGTAIAVLSDFGGKNNIWLFDPTGTVYQQVTNLEEEIGSFAYSPNPGENLLVVSVGSPGRRRLALVSLASGEIVEFLTQKI